MLLEHASKGALLLLEPGRRARALCSLLCWQRFSRSLSRQLDEAISELRAPQFIDGIGSVASLNKRSGLRSVAGSSRLTSAHFYCHSAAESLSLSLSLRVVHLEIHVPAVVVLDAEPGLLRGLGGKRLRKRH